MGAEAGPALVEGLASQQQTLADEAGRVLQDIGPAAVPALIGTLGTDHPLVRARAAVILGRIGEGDVTGEQPVGARLGGHGFATLMHHPPAPPACGASRRSRPG